MKNKRRKIHMLNKKKLRRKQIRKKYMLYYIMFGIIIVTTLIILSLTVFFTIDEIEIVGVTKNIKNDVLKISQIKTGDNLILTNSKKAENNIINFFKNFDSVYVTKNFPHKILIKCCEGKPKFYYKKSNKEYVVISEKGRIVKNRETKKPNNAIELVLAYTNFNDYALGDFLELEENLDKNFKIIQDAIYAENAQNVTKIEINNNMAFINFEDRVTLEIEDINDAQYLINVSLKILKNLLGPFEKGKIIYVKSKKSIHFVPSKKFYIP